MLDLIKNDHRNLAILLDLLRDKVARLAEGQPINYTLIRDVIEYMQEYADRYHHKYEDAVYGYYLSRKGDTQALHKLEQEHDRLTADTASFRELIELILLDSVVPSDTFRARLQTFIEQQQQHMQYEDREILPLLESQLELSDWEQIDSNFSPFAEARAARATVELLDPLFGPQLAQRYRDLAQRLQRSARDAELSAG
mgnify:FL=1